MTPYHKTFNMPKKEKITMLFDSIAPEYDRLNHLLSLDIDKTWRRRAVRRIVDRQCPLNILDVACGTGDFTIAIARKAAPGSRITGLDLSEGMLGIGREKVCKAGLSGAVSLEQGDSEDIPYGEGSFDRISVAFGVRNFEHLDKGLEEMFRVLKTGGKAVILELSVPRNGIMLWLYEYLPASVLRFPGPEKFKAIMEAAGFSDVRHKSFTFGICRMYTGVK